MKWRTLGGLLIGSLALLSALPTQAANLVENPESFERQPNEFVSAIVMIPKTHQVLYAYEADKPHVAASLTKLANALVFVKRNPSWNKVVSLLGQDEVGGGRLRVNSGARMTIQDLFFSSITASANNAAQALVRLSGLTPAKFYAEMNKEVKALGAKDSHFVDASGMDPRNITTAQDMALIAEKAFSNATIRRAATSAQYKFTIRNTGEVKVLRNTNTLLTQDQEVWVTGGKTGYLEESMYNLVTIMRPMTRDGKPVAGKDVIVVVFGAPTKEGQFITSKRLAQWAWENYGF